MRKPISLVVVAALIYGGYTLFQKYQIEGLDRISFKPRSGAGGSYGTDLASNVPVRQSR